MVDAVGQLSHLIDEVSKTPKRNHNRPTRATQRQVRLTPREIDCLVEDRAAGRTIAELAEMYGCHRTTVMRHLRNRCE